MDEDCHVNPEELCDNLTSASRIYFSVQEFEISNQPNFFGQEFTAKRLDASMAPAKASSGLVEKASSSLGPIVKEHVKPQESKSNLPGSNPLQRKETLQYTSS